jgi:hypothetical protein
MIVAAFQMLPAWLSGRQGDVTAKPVRVPFVTPKPLVRRSLSEGGWRRRMSQRAGALEKSRNWTAGFFDVIGRNWQ